ncbi:hypothetical protein RDI58_001283 [Solanum bulbocastanum]|uniref:Uncharacterized protein n=1 Tax=Solanum bulbocastanum TaxID=147425 RepID=A0AAN8U4U3_SOLBU
MSGLFVISTYCIRYSSTKIFQVYFSFAVFAKRIITFFFFVLCIKVTLINIILHIDSSFLLCLISSSTGSVEISLDLLRVKILDSDLSKIATNFFLLFCHL